MASYKHTCVQGDSYAYDYTPKSGDTLDANWSGKWAIVDKLGAGRTSLASGNLAKNSGETSFEMRIIPSDTSAVAVGTYYLVVQVTNTSINFNKEIVQDSFEITKQGI